MPIVSYKSKERIDHQYHLMLALKSKCATCDIFNGISPDKEYLFTIQDYDEPADIAVAVYYECKTYAVYASDDLAENQLSVFCCSLNLTCFVLRSVQQTRDHSTVFSFVSRGSLIVTVEPSPCKLSMPMLPPCASTISFAIASPRPVPPVSLVRDFSTR